ncbi:E3 ubiquitin-protein ligase TRIM9-like [Saccostrea echinata]|uniref:E3 ubiquitin-protein ligase TRIM9-like n=1 Tax=Saccostrea echinata TaxID=191078 RepID=UPI002A8391F8|nr:E3 ubiquitin-protein ligase TRIM9-like [Saccostrea echinata]
MNPLNSATDVIRCDLCEVAVVQIYCNACLVNLCKACVGVHMCSDESKTHDFVPFKLRKSTAVYPGCTFHHKKRCEKYCYQCDIPICSYCLLSYRHQVHKVSDILQVVEEKKKEIIKKQTELKERIYPTYQDIAFDIQNRMSQLEKEYGDLSSAITKHGEDWHREIDKLVKNLKAQADEMKNTQLHILHKHLNEINIKIHDIMKEIELCKCALDSNDILILSDVKFNVEKYKNLPKNILPSSPIFMAQKVQGEKLIKVFGTLSSSSVTSDKLGYSMNPPEKSSEAGSSPPVKQLLDKPETVTTIYNYAFAHGEDWDREIDKLVKNPKAQADELKNTQLQIL